MTELSDQVAFVTAAAGRGIGQAIARRLAAAGATVVVTDIHEARTRTVAASLEDEYPDATVVGIPLDVGDRAHIDAVTDEVRRTIGPIRILVNNAAVNVPGDIYGYNPEDWDRCISVSLSGAWYLSKLSMMMMREAGGGVIANVSSYAPDIGGAGIETPYSVAKGGLNALTRACAHEGGPFNIRVVSIAMGLVLGTKYADDHPEMEHEKEIRGVLGRLPRPDDIAEVVGFLVSDRARHITGEIVNVAAGAYMRP